ESTHDRQGPVPRRPAHRGDRLGLPVLLAGRDGDRQRIRYLRLPAEADPRHQPDGQHPDRARRGRPADGLPQHGHRLGPDDRADAVLRVAGRFHLRQVRVPRPRPPVRHPAPDAGAAVAARHRPQLRHHVAAGMGRDAPGADRARRGGGVRYLLDAAVLDGRDPERPGRCGPGRRLQLLAALHQRRAAAAPAGAGVPRDLHLHHDLERLLLAADRAGQPGGDDAASGAVAAQRRLQHRLRRRDGRDADLDDPAGDHLHPRRPPHHRQHRRRRPQGV
ncbi:MAG: ABC transporter, permease protein 2 (cluster 1, maltose/g3p/polyamine/iron), partial [uncultured Thermomicrobiales bacterium]